MSLRGRTPAVEVQTEGGAVAVTVAALTALALLAGIAVGIMHAGLVAVLISVAAAVAIWFVSIEGIVWSFRIVARVVGFLRSALR